MIRVLRVLEYEYRDLAHYEADSANWTHTLPIGGHGAQRQWKGPHMVSQVIRLHELDDNTRTPPSREPTAPNPIETEKRT